MTKLNILTKEEARMRMNTLGTLHRPFFFLIDFDESHCIVEEPSAIPTDELLYVFPKATNVSAAEKKTVPVPQKFTWKPNPQPFETYQRSFEIVHQNLHRGNSFLTNLTCATPVDTDLSLRQVFEYAHARYKLWVKDCFVVFSPEIFVRIEGGMIFSHPMKGTADASSPGSAEKLLADEKESAEHATITDLIRNDLSQVASEVTVTRYQYLDKIETNCGPLWQMSSEISGCLPEDYADTLGDLFFRLLPAGSITGAPKKKTVEIIREAETYDRGYYTGIMGFFDGKDLDSAVLIRFLEQDADGKMVFKSGGGITFKSKVENEYNEMKEKVYVPIY